MTDLLVSATLPDVNGRAEDAAVNTFAFHAEGALTAELLDNVLNGVADFYRFDGEGQPAGSAIGGFLAHTVDRTANRAIVKAYDITGKLGINPATGRVYNHGSPVGEQAFTLPAAQSSQNEAPQVAVVVTLRARDYALQPVELPNPAAPPATTRPRTRRTGRLYIGPLGRAAGNTGNIVGSPLVVSSTFRTALAASVEQLQQNVNAGDLGGNGKATFCVWSRQDAAMHAIVEAQVDDSFDVIRSRKRDQTVRTSRVFAPVPDLALGA